MRTSIVSLVGYQFSQNNVKKNSKFTRMTRYNSMVNSQVSQNSIAARIAQLHRQSISIRHRAAIQTIFCLVLSCSWNLWYCFRSGKSVGEVRSLRLVVQPNATNSDIQQRRQHSRVNQKQNLISNRNGEKRNEKKKNNAHRCEWFGTNGADNISIIAWNSAFFIASNQIYWNGAQFHFLVVLSHSHFVLSASGIKKTAAVPRPEKSKQQNQKCVSPVHKLPK